MGTSITSDKAHKFLGYMVRPKNPRIKMGIMMLVPNALASRILAITSHGIDPIRSVILIIIVSVTPAEWSEIRPNNAPKHTLIKIADAAPRIDTLAP